jgi:hypothetical protein
MANKKKSVSSGYAWAMFFLCIFCVLCAVSVAFTYKNGQNTYDAKHNKTTTASSLSNEITVINYNATLMVSGSQTGVTSSMFSEIFCSV